MRKPDIAGPQGDAWKVPLDRLRVYVAAHEGDIHPASRGDAFDRQWRDVWYIRRLEQQDLEALVASWVAVVLQDIRTATTAERVYAEAEWDLTVFPCDPKYGAPSVHGDALFEWDQAVAPPIIYQFHGLTDRQVLNLGNDPRKPVTFAQYIVEAICQGAVRRDDETWAHRLSAIVNGIREVGYGDPPRRPLAVAGRTGFIIELEDESTVTLPASRDFVKET